MLTLELNVGLLASPAADADARLAMLQPSHNVRAFPYVIRHIMQRVSDAGFIVESIALMHSSTEPTLYLRVQTDRWDVYTALLEVSDKCAQDCIAVRYPDGTGELIGARVSKWGVYNDALFLRPIPNPQILQPVSSLFTYPWTTGMFNKFWDVE